MKPTQQQLKLQAIEHKSHTNFKIVITGTIITTILAVLLIKPYIYYTATISLIGVVRGIYFNRLEEKLWTQCQNTQTTS